MGPPGSLEVGGHGFRIQGVRPRLAGLGIGGYWRATVESRLNEWFTSASRRSVTSSFCRCDGMELMEDT